MDKRFFLALALTAVVVILTPLLFPSPSLPPASVKIDSTATLDSVARIARESIPSVLSVRDSVSKKGLGDSVLAPVDSIPRSIGAVDTVIVATPLAEYHFTSLGAVPISIGLKGYQALNGSDSSVTLASPVGRLLDYRVFLTDDTLDLRRVPFMSELVPGSSSTSVLTYRAKVAAIDLAIRYTFVPDSYLVRVSGQVSRDGAPVQGFLGIELPNGLESAEADSLDDQRYLAYAIKPQRENARGVGFGKLDPGERHLETGPITWVAAKNKYFIIGLLTPDGDASFAEVQITGGPRTGRNPTRASGTVLESLRDGAFAFELYTGPQEWRRLLALGRDFENSNPYGGFLQGVVQPFATIVMRILLWMRATLDLSYGWVLVVFGVVVRLLLWPLNQKAMRTSIKMTRLQPELAEIQKKFKSDPQRMQGEIMRVYREHGMSPFSSLSGCLPMLLPMPVLFALFFVFQNTIEFRGVPFLWLPDISLKDPYYIVPIVMGLSMYVLSVIGMRNSPPNPQAKIMAYALPVMMTVFFLNLASGLNLYYAIQNITAIPQQWLIASERAKATPQPVTQRG